MKKNTITLFLLIFTVQLIQSQCIRVAPFQDGPDYTLDGTATLSFLIDGTKTLSFGSSFATPSGPDLHVYLSNSAIVSTPNGVLETPDTIELGILKSITGAQTYDLSNLTPAVELNQYSYVHVHCKEHNHYWGGATFGTASGGDCGNLSVSSVEDDSITVYPTVVKNDEIIVELKSTQKVSLFLYSVVGELVQKPLTLTKEINTIDTSSLRRGMYILKIDFENSTRTQKIIIE